MGLKLKYLFVVAFLVFSFCQTVSAELVAVGPTNTTNNFPQWYLDENGLALELCLTATGGVCNFDPIVLNNIFSAQIGFGERAFYWSATTALLGAGATGSLDMGLLASFSGIPGGSTTGGTPADGEQITFSQIVVGPIIGLTPGGVYKVIHPYGVIENLIANAVGAIPVQRQDLGCAIAIPPDNPCPFTAALGSPIGPFLRWDPAVTPLAPVGFVGNPTVPHTVIGSPFGTNFFRIEGPNAGGSGVNFKQTDLFRVQGKIFAGLPLPLAPLIVERASYSRPFPPQIEVLASSSPGLILDVSGAGIATTQMTPDGSGNYFAQIFNPAAFPSSITVTIRDTARSVTSALVDIVTITLAEFNTVTSTLTIQASSSDTVTSPTLTALGFGNLVAGSLNVSGVTVPPAQVIVTSSAGGSATAPVSVISKPLAINDTALTLRTLPVVVGVLSNDRAFGSGNSLDPTTVTPTTPPKGTAVATGTGGITYTPTASSFTKPIEKDSFIYTVKDIFTQESNVAIVTVTVAEGEVLTVTKAQFTTRSKYWQITGKSKTSAAATGKGIAGNKITLHLGPDTTGPVIGTGTVNAFGGWTVSKINSSVPPGGATQVTAESEFGTIVTFSPITIR
jgi:hypothetical protein